MESKVPAPILYLDNAFRIRELLVHTVLNRSIRIDEFADINSVFDFIAKVGRTTEWLLQIYIHDIKESYERGDLEQIGSIPGENNPADALFK